MQTRQTIAVIGGTGPEGGGLATRLAHAGYTVILGSRDTSQAESAAAEINAAVGVTSVTGMSNDDAAAKGEIVLLTVPYAAQSRTAQSLRQHLIGKILIDATVPLVPPKVSRVQLPDGRSAVAALQETLGPEVKVVAGFQNVSAHHLKDLQHDPECDVLICGDDTQACETVIGLVNAIGLKGFYAGSIANSVAAEALTSILITINRKHKVSGAGIRITGIPL